MTDYHPLIAKAVAGLEKNTGEARRVLYERARTALVGQLRNMSPPLTESDILGPSEAFRAGLDYYSHTKNARAMLERLAAAGPTTLACMHGSTWRGDGAQLLRALADALSG